jgi:hypothetical protein
LLGLGVVFGWQLTGAGVCRPFTNTHFHPDRHLAANVISGHSRGFYRAIIPWKLCQILRMRPYYPVKAIVSRTV